MRRDDGVTLMEAIVVVVIVSVLTAIVIAALSGARNASRERACQAEIAALRAATETFFARSSPSRYGNERTLVDHGILAEASSRYDVTVGPNQVAADSSTNAELRPAQGRFYSIKVSDPVCGPVGQGV